MMKTIKVLYITAALQLLLFVSLGYAAIQVNPSATYTGTPVTGTVSGTIGVNSTIRFQINFGDGSPVANSPLYTTPGNHSFTATHSYSQAGGYTITATSVTTFTAAAVVIPPIIVTETSSVTIQNRSTPQPTGGGGIAPPIPALAELPRGIVGEEYGHTLDPTPTGRSNRYQVTRGKLPPGLEIDRNGDLSGIPTQKGVFNFTVRVTGRQRAAFSQKFTLYVDPGELGIKVDPQTINATGGGITTEKVTFSVVHPTVQINESIRSSRGEFLVNGRSIGFNSVPMTINLNSAKPSASETMRIPQNVIRSAQSAGTGKITYRRTFTSRNLNSGAGETRVTVRSPASGELRIVGLRIFFEQNNRPIILVPRNSRDLTGVIELKYHGSGMFKGLWHVDGRIIQRVQKHLNYGKVLTLKTPAAPPLPTYSEGAHRLQFVITEPASAAERIDFPEAIYHVEAKKSAIVVPISLTAPENGAEITAAEEFSWSKAPRTTRYQIEFLEKDKEGQDEQNEPFFTAHSKTEFYLLPEKIVQYKFDTGKTYFWQVRGFNSNGELTGESDRRRFSLAVKSAYVPGQAIFIVDDNDRGKGHIDRIIAKYNLAVVEQTKLSSLDKIMIVCSTKQKAKTLLAKLQTEEGLYLAQPNFIFSTMAGEDPLLSQQTIHRLLDLDRIQQQVSGKNVVVAVIDTGVDIDHKDLSSRIKAHENFVAGSPYRAEIHGTAVAGIIAGARNDFGIRGIAPDAALSAYRACEQQSPSNSEGRCYSSSIAKAIDRATTDRVNIANLSIGSQQSDKLISDLIDNGHRQGVVFVAPVGNDPQLKTVSFPASHPKVISVAGFGDNNTGFPNKILAMAADAIAPAQHIFTSVPGDKHNFLDGTSYSSAIISGLLTLSLEKHGAVSMNFPRFDQENLWQNQVAAYIGK